MRALPTRLFVGVLLSLATGVVAACSEQSNKSESDPDAIETPDDDTDPDTDDEKPAVDVSKPQDKSDAGSKQDAATPTDDGSLDAGSTIDSSTTPDAAPASDAAPVQDATTADAANLDAGAQDAGNLCPTLPAKFAIDGCGLPTLCHVKQSGCNWEAKCGTRTLTGSGAAASAATLAGFNHPDGRSCTLKVSSGQVSGSCSGGDAGMCAFTTSSSPLPTPFCVDLPTKFTAVNVCSAPPSGAQNFVASDCDVIQSACSFQASCNGGADVFAGTVTNDGLRWDTSYGYRCTGVLANGAVTGNCVQRTGIPDGGTPATCPFAVGAAPTAPSDCAQDLPSAGFVLSGCQLDGAICHMSQRGCIWQANCGSEVFAGRQLKSGEYTFKTRLGANCSAKVENGVFSGGCSWGNNESCSFTRGTSQGPSASCYAAPASGFNSSGCAGDMTCTDLLQNGCDWQARCALGGSIRIYRGTSLANGLKFPSGNYGCWAYKEAAGERLVGGCSTDGSEVTQCSPRVNNGQLILTPRAAQ